MRLANKRAVITGAASGMGAASAIMFAKEGAKVMLVDLNDEKGQKVADSIVANGGTALYCHADITNEEQIQAVIDKTANEFGGVDIVFNIAGAAQRAKPLEQITDAEWERIMDVNVKSIWLMAKASSAELRKSGSGVILNVGSVGGLRPRPGSVCYSASKGAVQAITTALAVELASAGIRCNCINPGPTDTPLLSDFIAGYQREMLGDISKSTLLGKMVEPEDIAYAGVFLASDEATKITGAALPVDSGLMVFRGVH